MYNKDDFTIDKDHQGFYVHGSGMFSCGPFETKIQAMAFRKMLAEWLNQQEVQLTPPLNAVVNG